MIKKIAIITNSKFNIHNYLSNDIDIDIYVLKLNTKQIKYAVKNAMENIFGSCHTMIVKSYFSNNFSYNIYNDQNQLFDEIAKNNYKYVILLNFGIIIRKRNIELLNGKLLNLHPSFLPYFGGRHAINRSIFHTKTIGITLHHVTQNIDKGEIVYHNYQENIKIYNIKKIRKFYMKENIFIIKNIDALINRRLRTMPKVSIDNKFLYYSVHQPKLFKYMERSIIIIVFIISINTIKKTIFYKS